MYYYIITQRLYMDIGNDENREDSMVPIHPTVDIPSTTTTPSLAEIDRKINLKFIKEKKTSRTYISGLETFLPKKLDREKLCQDLRKVLGTGSNIVQDEKEKPIGETKEKYGFQGNHIDRIATFLTKKYNIPQDKIIF